MEQTTAPATTAPAPRDSFEHAYAVVGQIVPLLAQRPFAVQIEEDWPVGWRGHLKFRASEGAGLFEFAALVDIPITRADTSFGVHFDAIAHIEDIEVRASALVTEAEAARLEGSPAPEPSPAVPDEPQPIEPPPSPSVLAELPAIVPVLPAPAVHLDAPAPRLGSPLMDRIAVAPATDGQA
ncbi:hypothetical protein [Streptomyces sp. NPDC002692]